MQNGDLEAHVRDRIIVVVEGVLCLPIQEKGRLHRWGRERTVAYHINWYDVPLKRLIVIHERNPDLDVELVSFISQAFVDLAAEYLDIAGVPYGSIKFWDFHMFTDVLKYQRNLRAIYDTDPDQLDHYGLYGYAVLQGHDF